jgi:hypothetical protein
MLSGGKLAAAHASGSARLQMDARVVVHTSAGAQVPSGLMLHKSEKLAINKINRLTAPRLSFYSHPFDQYLKATH